MNDLHGILFAYHSDANLGELTRPRNTSSLPFGGRYRLIDFMLSNYVNAGISDVGLCRTSVRTMSSWAVATSPSTCLWPTFSAST